MWQTLGLGLQKKIYMDKDHQFGDKNTPENSQDLKEVWKENHFEAR